MKKKRKIINRVLAAVLSLVLFFGTLDTTVFAAEEPTEVAQTGDTGSSTESGAGSGTWEGSITVTDGNDSYDVDLEGTQTDSTKQGTGEYTDSEGDKVSVSFEEKKEEYNPGDEGVVPIPDNAPTPEENGGTDSMPEPEEGGDITSSEPEEGGNTPSPTPEGSTTPTAPAEGEEAASMASPENEGGTVLPAEPEGDGEAEPAPAATPDTSISVTVDTSTEGNSETTKFTVVEPEKVVSAPVKPDKFNDEGKHHEENSVSNEYGEGTETVDETWEYQPLEEEGYHGYKTTTTKKIITEAVKEGEPETRPEGSYDIDGGYQYTETMELDDGTARTIIVTVTNGQTHTKIIDNIIIETIEKVKLNDDKKAEVSEGSVSVSVTKVVNGKAEVSEPLSFDIITGEYGNKNNSFGYDEKNDLYDREGSKGVMTVKVNAENDEGEPEVYVWTYNKSTKKLGYQTTNGKKQTLQGGTEVYVYEVVNFGKDAYLYRIGKDDWIISNDASEILGGTYQVQKPGGIYIVGDETKQKGETPSRDNRIGSRASNAYVRVLEIDGEWCRIATDGNSSGWVLKSQLSALPVMDKQWDEQKFAGKFDDGKAEELFGPEAEGYDYYYFGENGLESSIRVDLEDGSNTWLAHQFVLRDRETNKFYVYCADLGTDAKKDYRYKLIPLDHVKVDEADKNDENYVGYLSKEALESMKAIAQNGYWGTDDDLKELKGKLKADGCDESVINSITPGIALTATQAALWVYGTSDGKTINRNTDDWVKYLGEFYNYSVDKKGNASVAMNTFDKLGTGEKAALKTVFQWLLAQKADENTKAVTKDNFATSATITVNKVVEEVQMERAEGSVENVVKYDTDVSFAMQVRPSSKNDDLIVTVYANVGGKETVVASCRLSGDPKEGENFSHNIFYEADSNTYRIKGVTLPNGAEIRINLKGVQDLGKGIYIFKSDEKDGGAQTFIGRSGENSTQDVDLSVELSFNVTAAKATITKTTVAKGSYEIPEPPKPSNNPTPTPGSTPDPEDSPDPTPSETPGTRENPDPENTPDPDPVPSSEPVPTPVTVPDPEVPLARVPGRLVEITDGPVPLAARPNELVEILDEEVPLAAVPLTGGISDIWYIVTAVAACSLLALLVKGRKKRKY